MPFRFVISEDPQERELEEAIAEADRRQTLLLAAREAEIEAERRFDSALAKSRPLADMVSVLAGQH